VVDVKIPFLEDEAARHRFEVDPKHRAGMTWRAGWTTARAALEDEAIIGRNDMILL
jgi:hypothetical protein